VDIVLVGPGRAGLALAVRFVAAGHRVVGVVARTDESAEAGAVLVGSSPVPDGEHLPKSDLLVIAVRDDDVADAARSLAPRSAGVSAAVHVSGLTSVAALDPLAATMPVGSFHPLQTLPDPQSGARRLAGAWVAVTVFDEGLASTLDDLARSIGCHPFRLADEVKPLYHAAAAAASNYPIAALAMAERLFSTAGVPFEAARPLVEAVVANAFELGPGSALTGPIARGDVGTVGAQVAAVAHAAPDLLEHFRSFGLAVADLAGQGDEMKDVLR